jgi:hypothetical protein
MCRSETREAASTSLVTWVALFVTACGSGETTGSRSSRSAASPSAMERACWLPDGRLVLWRPARAAGGPAGTYIADRAGQGAVIPTSAVPVGQLAAP